MPVFNPLDLALFGGQMRANPPSVQPPSFSKMAAGLSASDNSAFVNPLDRFLADTIHERIRGQVAGDNLAFGNMPMANALGMNWEQSRLPPTSAEVESTLNDIMGDIARRNHSFMPGGASQQRRFGADSPLVNPPRPQSPGVDPAQLQALQDALSFAANNQSDNGSMRTNIGGNDMLFQGSGNLESQPWFDELIALGQAGGGMPTIKPLDGRGLNEVEQAGIQERRRRRLGNAQAGLLPMEERRALVRNKAQGKSDARDLRMGNMDPMAAQLAALQRTGADGDMLNLAMGGAPYAAQMADTRMKGQLGQQAIDAEFGQMPGGMETEVAMARATLAAVGGGRDEFVRALVAQGRSEQDALRLYQAATGRDPHAKTFWEEFSEGPAFSGFPEWMGINTTPY